MTTQERLDLAQRMPQDKNAIVEIAIALGVRGSIADSHNVRVMILSMIREVEKQKLIDDLIALVDWVNGGEVA